VAESRRTPLRVLIGQRVRELREAEGWSQDRLAARARDWGLGWNRSQLAKVERGEREVTVGELPLLALVLLTSVHELLGGDARAELTASASMPLSAVREVFAGVDVATRTPGELGLEAPITREVQAILASSEWSNDNLHEYVRQINRIWPDATAMDILAAEEAMAGEVERNAARRLDRRPLEVALLARRLWGATIAEERDRRLGSSEAAPRVRQAERGHVTRALLAELRAALGRALGPDAERIEPPAAGPRPS
jgi:transcriptional regulator with XRE-family HTH domain